eukprot:136141-Hanusia_phi.AAC.1
MCNDLETEAGNGIMFVKSLSSLATARHAGDALASLGLVRGFFDPRAESLRLCERRSDLEERREEERRGEEGRGEERRGGKRRGEVRRGEEGRGDQGRGEEGRGVEGGKVERRREEE